MIRWLSICSCVVACSWLSADEPVRISGIYPHLTMYNEEGECGTGAVVPWGGRLWAVTYAPHKPKGSTDKLYEITPDLTQIIRPESIGGTPANRMIHRESNQLFIGPYAIDGERNVRVIPYETMFGRPTGNARHLTDPANKIYFATMEEGIYEVDVHTLDVKTLFHDEADKGSPKAGLPGYHGKGFYSGQGRVVYANNGEHGGEAQRNPFVASGVLAEWFGPKSAEDPGLWDVVLRNQFTEVTGPGGIYGNENPKSDPIWSVGWDAKSLILMCLDNGKWHRYRLPKASHSYDGAHGWNTEWPRIRDIGEDDLLMTMHGMFWRFPKTFSSNNANGIRPRSNYLKVIGDFCRWNDRIVCGCDDTANSEFLNKRKAKGEVAAPQSQSNLWFLKPEQLDQLGPVIGRGGVWVNEDVEAGAFSDPMLVAGFDRVGLWVSHTGDDPVVINVRTGQQPVQMRTQKIELDPHSSRFVDLTRLLEAMPEGEGDWVRLFSEQPLQSATAYFQMANNDARREGDDTLVGGLAAVDSTNPVGGLIRARGGNKKTLSFLASKATADGSQEIGYYELDGDLKLTRVENATVAAYTRDHTKIPEGILSRDEASAIFTDDEGRRWRLPVGSPDAAYEGALGFPRVAREVATERDLFNAYGLFYELPARNADGFRKVRPVATHNLAIKDFCSYRGLLVLSGVDMTQDLESEHLIKSDDGQAALWVGAVDDLWQFGKAVGTGGPWKDTAVQAGQLSDPYLLTGFDRKAITLSHDASEPVSITVEVDITGRGDWVAYRTFDVPAGETLSHKFKPAFGGYWLRCQASKDCHATAQLVYE